MATAVADRSSNVEEQVVHAAKVIGRSKYRSAIFREIYRGKRGTKTVSHLMAATGFSRIRVLDAGKLLADQELVSQTRVQGETAYAKVGFFQRHRNRVLRLAGDPKAQALVPTKRNPQTALRLPIRVELPRKQLDARRITIDDIDSFAAIRRVSDDLEYVAMPEVEFKRGVARILGERGDFKDWGGEQRDLSSTKVRLGGKRKATAFAFKGPGRKGKLVPGGMGKNGDQIQRLFRCPADVFLVQYWAEIDDSVVEQLEQFARIKSYFEGRRIWYGVIDGSDSARLIQAYRTNFASKRRDRNVRRKS
jgi:hypothetical protein